MLVLQRVHNKFKFSRTIASINERVRQNREIQLIQSKITKLIGNDLMIAEIHVLFGTP